MGFLKKKKVVGNSEDKNFAKYSERIFSQDEGLKDKAHQELVAALEDNEPFYLAEGVYFKSFYEMEQKRYILEFYIGEEKEPYRIALESEEFEQLFEYVVAVREDIFSDISITKDSTTVMNLGRNAVGVYWLDIVQDQNMIVKVVGNRTLMIKLVHSLFYAKHYEH